MDQTSGNTASDVRLPDAAFKDFESASRSVLQFMHKRLGFSFCMVTRNQGEQGMILRAEDHEYGFGEGSVYPWADSFCSRMISGRAPRVAPQAMQIPAYAESPFSKTMTIGAYIGVPLRNEDGSLFGTLCAIDSKPKT